MLETDREAELDPVLRCPGGAGVELCPTLSREGEGRDAEGTGLEVVCQEDVGARMSKRPFWPEEHFDGSGGASESGGGEQGHRNEQEGDGRFHRAPQKGCFPPRFIFPGRHIGYINDVYPLCRPGVFLKSGLLTLTTYCIINMDKCQGCHLTCGDINVMIFLSLYRAKTACSVMAIVTKQAKLDFNAFILSTPVCF